MSKLLKIDQNYREWIQNVSQRFRASQLKAAVKVNDEMLRFYWSMGHDIFYLQGKNEYGSGFYKNISNDLHNIFPDVHSFSVTNLKYMCYFYELYSDNAIRPQSGDKTVTENSQQFRNDLSLSIHPQLGDDFENILFQIPWGHHKLLIDKCKDDPVKAFFYIRKIRENNWSRSVLMNFLDTELYEREGKAITNFSLTLPAPQSDLAQAITRDPYNFDFLTIRERYDEKELKDALMANAEKFLLELGNGFALLGREVRLEVGDTEKFIDLLFYNVRIHAYVVIEVKTGEFNAAYAGQLGTYVVAVNHQMKSEQDNPTIGLLICKGLDRVEARYALESSSQPLGISSYELSKIIPEKFKGSLPTIEEIETELL